MFVALFIIVVFSNRWSSDVDEALQAINEDYKGSQRSDYEI